MTRFVGPLNWNTPIADEQGRPTPDFLERWEEQLRANEAVRELPDGTAADQVLVWNGTAWVPDDPPSGGGDVDSVFGRTGVVTAESGDYTAAQVTYDNGSSGLSATDSQAAIDETVAALEGKADTGHDHDDLYYTETETDALLADKSDTDHDHDDRYYTEAEVDALIVTNQRAMTRRLLRI